MYVMHYMYVRWNLWPFTSLHDISELHLIHWITSHIALALARRWFCTYCRSLIQCKPLNIWLIQLLPPSFIEVLSRGSTSSDMKKVLYELIFVVVVVVVVVIWMISFHNKLTAHRELGWVWHWFLNHLPQLTPFVKRDTIQVNKWKEKFGRLGKAERNGDNCPHLRWGGSEAAPWLVQPGSITKRKSTQAKFIVAASQSNSGMWWHCVTLVLSKLWIGG